jgi:hypothetical protein
MSVDFQELIAACRAIALASKLSPSAESDWRYFCRQYSEKFSTPLHEVVLMDPEWIVLNVFERQTDDLDTEDSIELILEKIYQLEDPNYDAKVKKSEEEFDRRAEEEEEERLRLGKSVHPSLKGTPFETRTKKEVPKTPEEAKPELPTEGYVNLDYLAKQDKEE